MTTENHPTPSPEASAKRLSDERLAEIREVDAQCGPFVPWTPSSIHRRELLQHIAADRREFDSQRECRGGFSTGELIAFLYAYPFPKDQWRQRVDEAFHGMVNL